MPRRQARNTATAQNPSAIQFDRIATAADLANEVVNNFDIGSKALLDTGEIFRLVSQVDGVGSWVPVEGAEQGTEIDATPTNLTNLQGGRIYINVAAATVNLPTDPFDGLKFTFIDQQGAGGHTIGRSAKTINSAAADYALTLANTLATIQYDATLDDWRVTGTGFGTAAISGLT